MINCSLRKALRAQPINQFPLFLAFKWGVRLATVLLAHHFIPECLSLTWERSTCISIYQGLQTSVMIFGLTTPASNVVSIRCILMVQTMYASGVHVQCRPRHALPTLHRVMSILDFSLSLLPLPLTSLTPPEVICKATTTMSTSMEAPFSVYKCTLGSGGHLQVKPT